MLCDVLAFFRSPFVALGEKYSVMGCQQISDSPFVTSRYYAVNGQISFCLWTSVSFSEIRRKKLNSDPSNLEKLSSIRYKIYISISTIGSYISVPFLLLRVFIGSN